MFGYLLKTVQSYKKFFKYEKYYQKMCDGIRKLAKA